MISDENLISYTRDDSQAYTQSKIILYRPIYVEPPFMKNYALELSMRLEKSLYDALAAWTHWFFMYYPHRNENLSMIAGTHDPRFWYTKNALIYQSHFQSRDDICLRTEDTFYASETIFF